MRVLYYNLRRNIPLLPSSTPFPVDRITDAGTLRAVRCIAMPTSHPVHEDHHEDCIPERYQIQRR